MSYRAPKTSESCPVYENGWDRVAEQVGDIHRAVETLAQNTSHLEKLDPISSTIKLFVAVIIGIFLIAAIALGRDVFLSREGISAKHVEGR